MTLIIHVTLSESFSFSSYLPASKWSCEVEGNVGIPVKVCCRLGHALKHELWNSVGHTTSCWESEIERHQHELWNGQKPPCYRHTGPDPQVLASSLCSPSTPPVWDPHRSGTMFRISTMTCVGLHRGQKISSRTELFMESLLWKHLHPRHTFPPTI